MKKILIVTALLTMFGCSSKVINNKEQTFTEYVILNKHSQWEGKSFGELEPECFPGIRLQKWLEQ